MTHTNKHTHTRTHTHHNTYTHTHTHTNSLVPMDKRSNIAAIVGGVVGSLVVILLAAFLGLSIAAMTLTLRKKGSYCNVKFYSYAPDVEMIETREPKSEAIIDP